MNAGTTDQQQQFRDEVNKHMGAHQEFARAIAREIADLKLTQAAQGTETKKALEDALAEMKGMYGELKTEMTGFSLWRQSIMTQLGIAATGVTLVVSFIFQAAKEWIFSKR